ncbi:MAG: cation diffusion facilitator family transporter [Ktedonobacterales bacterium]
MRQTQPTSLPTPSRERRYSAGGQAMALRGQRTGQQAVRRPAPHAHDQNHNHLHNHLHNHPHDHSHSLSQQALRLGFVLTVGILLIEVVGAFFAHSLALLSDAGHMFTDVIALGLAWFAAAQAGRQPNARRTFGYHRVGILSALANGLTLIVIAAVIAYEAYRRLSAPQPVEPKIMIVVALVAIALNLFIARKLHGTEGNLNTRAALLHILGDVGASVGVIVGAVVIIFTGATWVDPLISVLIAALIAYGAVRVVREAVSILLESAPHGISVPDLANDMRKVGGVHGVHDLHVWTITSGMLALSCHAIIADIPPSESARILDKLTNMLQRKYAITHATIQFESQDHAAHTGFCACQPDARKGIYCAALDSCGDQRPHDAHRSPTRHTHARNGAGLA